MKLFRKILIYFSLFLLCVLLGGLLLWYASTLEPLFYKNLAVQNVSRAEENSKVMTQKILDVTRDLKAPGEHEWSLEFTEDELNHWLEIEGKKKKGIVLPRRVSDPRGTIRENQIRCGARLDMDWRDFDYEGLISVDFFPYMEEPNVFKLKLYAFRVGMVPLPKTIVLGLLTKYAEEMKLPIEWLKEDGYHVLRVAFTPGELQGPGGRNLTIEEVKLAHGKMLARGRIAADKDSRNYRWDPEKGEREWQERKKIDN